SAGTTARSERRRAGAARAGTAGEGPRGPRAPGSVARAGPAPRPGGTPVVRRTRDRPSRPVAHTPYDAAGRLPVPADRGNPFRRAGLAGARAGHGGPRPAPR